MRDAVTSMLLTAVDGTIEGIQGSQADLGAAIESANEKISKLDDIKEAFAVFASLIGLDQAIVTGNPGEVFGALIAVTDAVT
jgi:hypothetical protein